MHPAPCPSRTVHPWRQCYCGDLPDRNRPGLGRSTPRHPGDYDGWPRAGQRNTQAGRADFRRRLPSGDRHIPFTHTRPRARSHPFQAGRVALAPLFPEAYLAVRPSVRGISRGPLRPGAAPGSHRALVYGLIGRHKRRLSLHSAACASMGIPGGYPHTHLWRLDDDGSALPARVCRIGYPAHA